MSCDIPVPLRIRLRISAGRNNRSMQAEIRAVLERAYGLVPAPDGEGYVQLQRKPEA